MKRRVCVVSTQVFCKSQSVLSSRCLNYFSANGWDATSDVSEADLVVINTCGFHQKAQAGARAEIIESLSRVRPGVKTVALGCLSRINREILGESPGLIIAAGLDDLNSIIGAKVPAASIKDFNYDDTLFARLGRRRAADLSVADNAKVVSNEKMVRLGTGYFTVANELQIALGDFICRMTKGWPYPFVEASHLSQMLAEMDPGIPRNKIYIQIGEGCVGACSYCVIRNARGKPQSRPAEDIIEELRRAYKPGWTVNLVADDCASWGVDIGKKIFDLVDGISAAIPGIPLDLCYVNPYWIDRYPAEFVRMCRTANINSINISLQSGSNRVITAMNRKYDVPKVLRTVDGMAAASPKTLMWAHMMAGYPGETLRDMWLSILAARHFNFYLTFCYSPVKDDQASYRLPALPIWIAYNAVLRSVKYLMMLLRLFIIPPRAPGR